MTKAKANKNVVKFNHAYIVNGNVEWYGLSGKQFCIFKKTNYKHVTTIKPSNCISLHFSQIRSYVIKEKQTKQTTFIAANTWKKLYVLPG